MNTHTQNDLFIFFQHRLHVDIIDIMFHCDENEFNALDFYLSIYLF